MTNIASGGIVSDNAEYADNVDDGSEFSGAQRPSGENTTLRDVTFRLQETQRNTDSRFSTLQSTPPKFSDERDPGGLVMGENLAD